MMSWRVTTNTKDDVMAGYKIFIQVKSIRFGLSIEDLHEIVQINLGPNVGDITTEYKPPRRGRIMLTRNHPY